MITLADFYRAYTSFRPIPDEAQRQAIEQGPAEPLFIVAGPGTGKTTCLTLRILKLVLVDDVPPRKILATTFTKKAAAELRSRILSWGFRLLEILQKDSLLSDETRERLKKVDINQVVTGTIDSICEQILTQYRDPGVQPPILADDFVAKTLLLQNGLFEEDRYRDPQLDQFLLDLKGGSKWGWNVGAKNDLLQQIWDRRFQDLVNWNQFTSDATGQDAQIRQLIDDAFESYHSALNERGMVDFPLLAYEALGRLRSGQLTEFLQQINVVLVDEYQDTNLLQEAIYFEMAKACNGALTVVGDDDQSLYRFRGATVELFSEFARRYHNVFGQTPQTIFLRTNYRSTRRIVQFVNDYAVLDNSYQAVRVDAKPSLEAFSRAEEGIPILGMFRPNSVTLAHDLADFVNQVFRGNGYTLSNGSTISAALEGGDVGDCALLCSSPAERNSTGEKDRLPLLMRQELSTYNIEVFNPRGEDLTQIPIVALFGGLLLECLDPGGAVEGQITSLNPDIQNTFRLWRDEAINFANSATAPAELLEYAMGWGDRDPKRAGWKWPNSVPVLELIYALVHFFPELHDDPEGQVYLEVFTRQISACEQVGKFSGRVVTDHKNQPLSDSSVKELLRNFLGPIAAGTIKVNEDQLEVFPRDRLSILSVHQAKGLEFPLTIVDVGSDFATNHHAHAFKRFPKSGGVPHAMENLLRPYSNLATPARSSVDRAFDDLYRQYFVAFSRPQQVLLLVGLGDNAPNAIANVATGWSRANVNTWQRNRPFVAI